MRKGKRLTQHLVQVTMDDETKQLLSALAEQRFYGNQSATIRDLIHDRAKTQEVTASTNFPARRN